MIIKAVNSSVDAKVGGLVQDRSKSGTTSAVSDGCFDCGAIDHYRGDPKCPKASSPRPSGPKHGLDEATNTQAIALIKEKLATMPARDHIPDDAQFTVSVGGKVVAKYCRHCGRFTKGASAHFTPEHKGARRYAYKGGPTSSPAPAPTPASSSVPVPSAGGNMASVQHCLPCTDPEPPVVDPSTILHQPCNYDLGSVDSSLEANLGAVDLSPEDAGALFRFF